MKKNIGKKIFDKNMETRITIRVDDKHLKIINQLMIDRKFDSKSEAIRFTIEDYQAKKDK